jgi:ketosteroid isomerase-like protein
MSKSIFLFLVITTLIITSCTNTPINMQTEETKEQDRKKLSELNAIFIKNFVTQDVASHAQLIHEDFVCIENNGSLVNREVYLKRWATDYEKSNLDTFYHTDENIRIFGNVALVRSKSVFTYFKDGTKETGYSIYVDTYLKENGIWRCIQAHMTPVKI